jgi:hypothetical protein
LVHKHIHVLFTGLMLTKWIRAPHCKLQDNKTVKPSVSLTYIRAGIIIFQVEKTQAIPGFELGFQESESCVLTNYTISPLRLVALTDCDYIKITGCRRLKSDMRASNMVAHHHSY